MHCDGANPTERSSDCCLFLMGAMRLVDLELRLLPAEIDRVLIAGLARGRVGSADGARHALASEYEAPCRNRRQVHCSRGGRCCENEATRLVSPDASESRPESRAGRRSLGPTDLLDFLTQPRCTPGGADQIYSALHGMSTREP